MQLIVTNHAQPRRTLALLMLIGLGLMGASLSPAHADYDPADSGILTPAQKKARAEQAAAEKRAREQKLRENLVTYYNDNPKALAPLNEKQLNDRWQQLEREKMAKIASTRNANATAMEAQFARMTPEQRAMIERMSGRKLEDISKEARGAAK